MSNPYQAGFGAVTAVTTSVASQNEAHQASMLATVKRLRSYSKPYWHYMLLALVLSLVSVLAQLYIPIQIGSAIDIIIKAKGLSSELETVLLTIVSLIVLASVTLKLQGYCLAQVASLMTESLRLATFEKLFSMPMSTFDRFGEGDLLSVLINDTQMVGDGILQALNQFLIGIVTIVGTLFFMLSLNVSIALIVIVLTPLSLLSAFFITKYSHVYFYKQQHIQGEMSSYAIDTITSLNLVQLHNYAQDAIDAYTKQNANLNEVGFKAQFISSLSNPATRLVNNLIYVVVATFGFIAVIQGVAGLTIGMVQAFLVYASQYTKPFNEISATLTQFTSALSSAERLFSVLDAPEIHEKARTEELDISERQSISLKDVTFSYDGSRTILDNISFDCKTGDKIALVGRTGSGKTTLLNLLMRFYDPDTGTIQIGDVDFSHINRQTLRSEMSMVLQETWIHTGTVSENISFGSPDVRLEDIKRVAKQACIHDAIEALPEGYSTIISPEDTTLSQGQLQLISLARCILKGGSIAVLDEATSSLDSKTESQVQQVFDLLQKGKTSFIVAHRLSTIVSADLILMLDHGKIIESGTHQELLALKGSYYSLYNDFLNGVAL